MINHKSYTLSTTFATHTATGNIDKNRDYQGTSNASDKGSWKNVVVPQGYQKIQLSEGIAKIISKDDLLILPTGTRMKLPKMYGIDSYRGEIVWNNNIIFQNCDMRDYDVLHDSPASLIDIHFRTDTRKFVTNTYILVETENIVFTLKQIKRTFAYKISVIQLEHSQLFILKDNTFMHYFSTNNISPQNTNIMA